MTITPKKALIIGISAAALLVIGLAIFNFISTEQVNIRVSSQDAEIFIDRLDEAPSSKGKGSASFRLAPGTYNVRAVDGDNETQTSFKLDKGTQVNLDLKIEAAKAVKDEAPFGAINLKATNQTVQFLRPGYGKLVRLVPETGFLQDIAPNGEYYSAVWADTQHAYLVDGTDDYWYLDDTSEQNLAFGAQAGSLKIAPGGKIAYLDSNKVVVRAGGASGAIEYELETAAAQPTLAFGADNKLLIYDTVISAEGEDQQLAPMVYSGNTILGKATEAVKGMVINGAAWSPSGDKLAVSAFDGLYVVDADTGMSTTLYKNYVTHPETTTWLNNDELLFFLDQTIWKVKASDTPIWTKLAHTEGSVNPADQFAVSPDGKKLYFSTATSQLEGNIYSLTLSD